ncbi:MAG: alanine racemase [Nocardioidaceae bacterium]|nr:alanine racemase [Nocardioidaceae bacterium]
MPLSLYVDGPRWRDHLTKTADDNPGLIPVAKGNGYGLTVGRLARRAEWLGVDTIAVGTYPEVAEVVQRFSGDILVMEPWRPFSPGVSYGDRVIHTVGRRSDLAALPAAAGPGGSPRVLLEALTSMRRHGFAADDLAQVGRSIRGLRVEGHAVHLPLGDGHVAEVERWLAAAPARRWFASHLRHDELDELSRRHPDVEFRPRVGTALWLGDRGALQAMATVLDAHRVRRGEQVGYRQRRIGRDGTVLIVSGGTAHGVALVAPNAAASPRARAAALAQGGLSASGRALSPYLVDGKQRWFAEPPHMQVSMIFVPSGATCPDVGDEVKLQVRFTTTTFDRVVVS